MSFTEVERYSRFGDSDDLEERVSKPPIPRAELEKKGIAFMHTAEYYQQIEDEEERMKAYRGLTVSTAELTGEDAEIKKNPFKFLNLPSDATFAQTRAAWIQLGKAYFPDLMNPDDKEQYNRIFGLEPSPIVGNDYDSWLESMAKAMRPSVLSISSVENLSPKEQEEYAEKMQAYRNKEREYESVKLEMKSKATKLMTTINKAYDEAKKRFSNKETSSFAGLEWNLNIRTSDFLKRLGIDFDPIKYDSLDLEGQGELRRKDGIVSLVFDYGDIYLEGEDY